jgi:hypothetical protein
MSCSEHAAGKSMHAGVNDDASYGSTAAHRKTVRAILILFGPSKT